MLWQGSTALRHQLAVLSNSAMIAYVANSVSRAYAMPVVGMPCAALPGLRMTLMQCCHAMLSMLCCFLCQFYDLLALCTAPFVQQWFGCTAAVHGLLLRVCARIALGCSTFWASCRGGGTCYPSSSLQSMLVHNCGLCCVWRAHKRLCFLSIRLAYTQLV